MPNVLRTPRARRDLADIWSFVARDSPESADRLIDQIGQKCDLLATFPEMGRRRDDIAPNLRSIPVGNYVVFYRAAPNGIEVIRVLHGARDLPSAFTQNDD